MNNSENRVIINEEENNKNEFEYERGKTRFIVSVMFPPNNSVKLEKLLKRSFSTECENT